MERHVTRPAHYGGAVACDGACGRRNLEEQCECFYHCARCRFDLCPECAADPAALASRNFCVYVNRAPAAANERTILLNACQNAIATGRDGRRYGWHDRGWATGEAMHAELLAGLEQRRRGLIAFGITREDAELIAERLRAERRLPRHGNSATAMTVEVCGRADASASSPRVLSHCPPFHSPAILPSHSHLRPAPHS